MSEFYERRRTAIKDGTALFAFFLGYVCSGAFAWPFLRAELDHGDMIRGLGYFLGAVLVTGLAAGALGLETGSALGGVWERYHRFRRARIRHTSSPPASAAERGVTFAHAPGADRTTLDAAHVVRDVRATPVRYASGRVDVEQYVALAERVCPGMYDLARMRDALAKTINLTAWDGDQLVGIARVVTDGYLRSVVLDLMVDPAYQRQGVGSTLLRHALAATPSDRLLICAQPASVGFFERTGCDRTITGFTLARAS